MDFNVESDISIDPYNLESECISMASTYYNYRDAAGDAKNAVSYQADLLKIISAERNIAIREAAATNHEKVTEGIITSRVQSDPQVVQAMKDLRDAESTYNRLSAAVSALEIKKSELDNLVKLKCNAMYVDSLTKPTRDVSNETISNYNRQTLTPLPNK